MVQIDNSTLRDAIAKLDDNRYTINFSEGGFEGTTEVLGIDFVIMQSSAGRVMIPFASIKYIKVPLSVRLV